MLSNATWNALMGNGFKKYKPMLGKVYKDTESGFIGEAVNYTLSGQLCLADQTGEQRMVWADKCEVVKHQRYFYAELAFYENCAILETRTLRVRAYNKKCAKAVAERKAKAIEEALTKKRKKEDPSVWDVWVTVEEIC